MPPLDKRKGEISNLVTNLFCQFSKVDLFESSFLKRNTQILARELLPGYARNRGDHVITIRREILGTKEGALTSVYGLPRGLFITFKKEE